MFKKFLPREESYFDDFLAMISIVEEMAKISVDFFSSEEYEPDIFKMIKPLEKKCDEVGDIAIRRLNETFITPFDREDIFSLIKKLDDISDILLAIMVRIDTFNVRERVDGAQQMAEIVYKQVLILKEIITKMENYGDDFSRLEEIRKLESEADSIYRNALRKIFHNDNTNALDAIKNKEVLEQLEKAADKCQTCVNVIQSILIKNS
ncbi:MAG: DUF47 family protein [Ignavibacteriales bacterium]|nr:MAG: DUF47 family protein [Ignavibacteriaceae bacterium]MBW7873708.1 DUF47 family protein [Ignavibacteria bacterium]MCZ2143933.1 DUF47 family protein [Ignavibacteriales bacterium]MBV6444609.1 hypothetical protein [Ignavibacteriaceae bacterium]MBZ0197562.1 DUF47 family protein [Ignavibacteriaceae bacterium]